MDIRPAAPAHASAIATIYNHYIVSTTVTFETERVTTGDMQARVEETQSASLPWLVAEERDRVLGYAYASKWKGRCAYRYSVESTVYLDADCTGRGIGKALYARLLDALRERGMHAVIGGVALPNAASIALHEALGFRKVAHFEQVGFKQDRWIDVGYWQLLLG